MRDGEYIVYVHTNLTNGKRYVGITSQTPEQRWLGGRGYKKSPHFWRAIQTYGWDGFSHEIVAENLTKHEAAEEEKRLIQLYDTTDGDKGYNLSTGGESGGAGIVYSPERKQRNSEMMKKLFKENASFREKTLERLRTSMQTDEIKRKRVESRRGWVMPEEQRRQISKAKLGRKLGPFTPEHIARIKEHHAGGGDPRPVLCVETGEHFACINDAARATGINKKGISGCCRNVPHYNTAGGLHWQFA